MSETIIWEPAKTLQNGACSTSNSTSVVLTENDIPGAT